MPTVSVFTWPEARGWLILSGGGTYGNDPETQALNKCPAGGTLVYVFAAGDADTAERHLYALEDAGGPAGFLVDVTAEDDETIREQFKYAGLILLADGPNAAALRGGLTGAGIEAADQAYHQGAAVLGNGAGAAVLGAYYLNQKNELKPGYGWLENAIIVPGRTAQQTAPEVLRQALLDHPDCYLVVLGADSALAFGPDGIVESWGERKIGITLGKAFLHRDPSPPEDSDTDQGE
jgi:hypothetical protein